MIDVSMGGSKVEINFAEGGSITINEFSDEGTPIEIPTAEIADGSKNMNGVLVTWAKPAVYMVSFTLIPGGEDDLNLRAKLRAQSLSGTHTPTNAFIKTLVLHSPTYNGSNTAQANKNWKTFTFYNGRLRGGLPAIGSNAEGKASPSTYTFMFEGID